MSEPIRDLKAAVRELGALPMSAGSRPTLRDVAENVIAAAMRQGHTAPAMLAEALESAQLLQSPETAAELERVQARLAEYERPADEDPIRYTLTEQAEDDVSVPRTERQRWQDIADALNAAHAAGMPVGIDLDGTLTDRNAWSVVWLSTERRWVVAGWEDDEPDRPVAVGETYRPVDQPDVRVVVTRVWQNEGDTEPGVAFDIHGTDLRGRPAVSHSALDLSLFRQRYRIDTTVPQPRQAGGAS